MKYMTFVVQYEDDQEPHNFHFGEKLMGGNVVGIAAFDALSVLDVAEKAIDQTHNGFCNSARKDMDILMTQNIRKKKKKPKK